MLLDLSYGEYCVEVIYGHVFVSQSVDVLLGVMWIYIFDFNAGVLWVFGVLLSSGGSINDII